MKTDISGKDVLFKVDGIVVGCATDISITYTTDMNEATGCRDTNLDGKFKEFKPGQNAWTAEASNAVRRFITDEDKAVHKSFTDFKEIWRQQKRVELEWGTGFQGDEVQTGFAYISNLSEANPLSGDATWSVSFQGTGDITPTINPVVTPATPTAAVTNDVANTFNWTNSTDFPNITDYQYTLDGGTTWTDATVKPVLVGNVEKAAGQVGVRVKATLKNDPSAPLYNTDPFTTS